MSNNLTRLLSLSLSFCLILEQSVFAQAIDLSRYFARNSGQNITRSDKFRPLHLRYLGYDNLSQDFKILLDKGDAKKEDLENKAYIEENTQTLLKYFFVGLSLPNEKFWVNLRPDSPDNILDPDLEKTDIGWIFLEADLQLKKDTSSWTSPQTPQGKAYWDKLYKKAGELFGNENITIPTITRPWIVPGEIIIREAPDNAYIYKATLKVMLEEDYLTSRGGSRTAPTPDQYAFSDPRLKELNQYSTQLIKETIIPKLTYEVNTSKRYAPLRQVYYSLILAQWFKQKYGSVGSVRAPGTSAPVNNYISMIDSGYLTNLTSSQPYDKQSYFQQYQKSFKDGEYNLQEPVYTPMGQSIRRYMSGGLYVNCSSAMQKVSSRYNTIPVSSNKYLLQFYLQETIKEFKNILKNDHINYPSSQTVILALVNFMKEDNFWRFGFPSNIDVMSLAQKKKFLLEKLNNLTEQERESLNKFYQDRVVGRSSKFFRYMEIYEKIARGKDFESLVKNKFKISRDTGRPQIIKAGIIGAAYGQEPITMAIYLNREINRIITGIEKEENLSSLSGKVYVEVLVIDRPGDAVYEKVKQNQIVYPEEIIKNSGFSKEEIERYFNAEASGAAGEYVLYKRSELLKALLRFSEVDLSRVEDLVKYGRGEQVDVLCVHNVLQHLPISYSGDWERLYNYINSLVVHGGLLSISHSDVAELQGILKESYSYVAEKQFISLYVKKNNSDIPASSAADIVNFTDFPNYTRKIKAVVNDTVNKMLSEDMPIVHVSFDPDCSIGRELAMPYSDIDGLTVIHDIKDDKQLALAKDRLYSALRNNLIEVDPAEVRWFSKDEIAALKVKKYKSFEEETKWGRIKLSIKYFKPLYSISLEDPILSSLSSESIPRKIEFPEKPKHFVRLNLFEKWGSLDMIIKDAIKQIHMQIGASNKNKEKGIVKVNLSRGALESLLEKQFVTLSEKGYYRAEWLGDSGKFEAVIQNVSSALVVKNAEEISDMGGIAFNALPIQTESVVSSTLGALPGVQAFKGDLDAEWAQIQAVFNAGIRPSIQRLADFAVAGVASPLATQRREDVLGLVAELLRRDEEDVRLAPADPTLKDLLNALESLL